MYSVRLTRIPEQAWAREDGLRLGLAELGLAEPFDSQGALVTWELTRLAGKVFGKVKAVAQVRLPCGRCLGEFSQPLAAEFSVLFEPASPERSAEGREAESEELVVPFQGEDIPLGEEIRQELELALPFTPLCRPDCAGLCPTCGGNLNQGACTCGPRPQDARSQAT